MPISRLFNSNDDAMAAVSDLRQAGFGAARVRVLTRAAGDTSAAAIGREGIPQAQARSHAESISQGATLVLVDAPFGAAARAIEVLQRHRPSDTGVPQAKIESDVKRDDAAPLSAAFQLPVLSRNPAPLSSFLNLPTLSRGRHGTRTFGLPLLARKAAPLSAALGLKVLSSDAAPLSRAIGLKVLSDSATPLSSALNLKVLSKEQTYLY